MTTLPPTESSRSRARLSHRGVAIVVALAGTASVVAAMTWSSPWREEPTGMASGLSAEMDRGMEPDGATRPGDVVPPTPVEPEGSVRPEPAAGPPGSDMQAFDPAMLAAMARGGGAGGGGSSSGTPWAQLSEGYRRVSSTAGGQSLYGVWVRDRDNQMLLELPTGFESQRHFIAVTLAGGDTYAGLQVADFYVYWRRLNDRLLLIQPTLNVRSTGDAESRSSTQRLFTDRLLLDVPILGTGPSGGPVIDGDAFLAGNVGRFFGARGARPDLARIAKAKAFPQNVEIAFEMPAQGGVLTTFHYSISVIPPSSGYQPRAADERVGYFTTGFVDLGRMDPDNTYVRYINRWRLEKADPSLRLSPPREPIVFYIDHAVPIRYRRWVRQGIEYWNKAFESIGIVGAIEVRQQDASTGAYMDLDPEDVRYNFVRWLANGQGTAIGPSRVNPMTGQILDADVVLTDGFIRAFWRAHEDLLPGIAMRGMGPETLAWLADNPSWDPRVRMAPPSERAELIARSRQRGVLRYGGHPAGNVQTDVIGDEPFDGLAGRVSQVNGLCQVGEGAMLNMATMRLQLDVLVGAMLEAAGDDLPSIPPEILEYYRNNPQVVEMLPAEIQAKIRALIEAPAEPEPEVEEAAPDPGARPAAPRRAAPPARRDDLLDGIPESFVGPQLADLTAHEIGHTLGLRHNFKASTIYDLDTINSEEMAGRRTWTGSVMDYHGWNIRVEAGDRQGDYGPIHIGPYDMWAIEYGYGFGDPKAVAARCADPLLAYATDEDTWGSDPTARQWDLSSNPLDYAMEKIRLAEFHRRNLIDRFVKDGQSWSRARMGYQLTLGQQISAVNMMAQWIGGAYTHRDKRGDPGARPPVVPVEADRQRSALKFVLEHAFRDGAYGLTPEILEHMGLDKWWDEGGFRTIFDDVPYPIHDTILGFQASTLTMLMNPTTLQRVFDNEVRVPSDQDTLTLPELFEAISSEIWSELAARPEGIGTFTPRQPFISSIRRNLQNEHIGRLIELSMPGRMSGAASEPVRTLARAELRRLEMRIRGIGVAPEPAGANPARRLFDAYSSAHLLDAQSRIERAMSATYIYNTNDISSGGSFILPFFQGEQPQR